MKNSKTVSLVDGSGFIFRAYYALPPLTNKNGAPVGAVLGFCNMLFKLLDEKKKEKVIVIFDSARKTFRNEIFPEYKSNRGEAPEDLVPQFSMIREAVDAFNIPRIEIEGYEADDLIATYANLFSKKKWQVEIVSSDKDLMQLINDDVYMLDPIKNKIIGKKEVFDKFGVYPDKVIDVQSLAGDSIDNVPGAPGIGIKTAAVLINEFGDLERLLTNFEKIKQNRRREVIKQSIKNIRISKKLVTLKNDISVEVDFSETNEKSINLDTLIPFLEKNNFYNLKSRITSNTETQIDSKKSAKDIRYNFINSIEELDALLASSLEEGVLAIDTETDSLKANTAKIIGISLSCIENEAFYIVLDHIKKENIKLNKRLVIEKLNPILQNKSVLKIGQNIKYDFQIFLNNGFSEMYPMEDTMLMSYTLHAGMHNHNLDYLSERYLGISKKKYKELVGAGKKEISFSEVDVNEAMKYACEDADFTFRLWKLFKKKLAEKKLFSVYQNIEKPLINVVAEMEKNGILVDEEGLTFLEKDFQGQLNKLQNEILLISKVDFNINSTKQLGNILFEHLKLPGAKKNKSGTYSTDSEVLERLAQEGFEIAKYIIEWRELSKLKNTYTSNLISSINPKTERIHTTYQMTGAQTGRISSSDPNIQNIPIKTENGKKIRKTFISKKGTKLVCFDYSQIELRLLAEIAGINKLKEAFLDNIDVHKLTASQVLNIPIDKVTSDQRRNAKTINFGIIYGLSAFGLSRQLGISRTFAKEYIENYFKQYPGINDYMDKMKKFLDKNGYVETLFGRRINLNDYQSKNPMIRNYAFRQAINAPIQGTAADIIKRAMINFFRVKDKEIFNSTKLLLQVHDELVFEIGNQNLEQVIIEIKKIMEKAHLPVVELHTPISVSVGSGKNWEEAH